MGLLDARTNYSPMEYPVAHQYWIFQHQSHWVPGAVKLRPDTKNWNEHLTDNERTVIARTLNGFVQSEVVIQEYWSNKVIRWFKKPEIQRMASAFGDMEGVHQVAYAMLQESLSLNDFEAFLHEPTAKAKIDRMVGTPGKTRSDIARSLAVFSAFNEGVNLFSSFAILMSFSLRNLLKGVGKIIEYSVKDESAHAHAGCWLFRQLMQEYPEIMTDELRADIYDAARLTVQLEDDFIDRSFDGCSLPNISEKDLKAYIRFRTNTKLKDLGFSSLYKNINKESLANLEWFSVLASGQTLQDFFAGRVATYGLNIATFGDHIWDE